VGGWVGVCARNLPMSKETFGLSIQYTVCKEINLVGKKTK